MREQWEQFKSDFEPLGFHSDATVSVILHTVSVESSWSAHTVLHFILNSYSTDNLLQVIPFISGTSCREMLQFRSWK